MSQDRSSGPQPAIEKRGSRVGEKGRDVPRASEGRGGICTWFQAFLSVLILACCSYVYDEIKCPKVTWSFHFANGHTVLQGAETSGHVQSQSQKGRLPVSSSRALADAWKGCCLLGNQPLLSCQFFPLVTLVSQWDHLPASPVTSSAHLSFRGEIIFLLSSGPLCRYLVLDSNRVPSGAASAPGH